MADSYNRMTESLSALMDGEVEEFESRRVLKETGESRDLREKWHRYQLAAAAMRRELPPRIMDLSARISAAIEEEPRHKPSFTRFLQPLGKVAVAASVAVIAVLGVQEFRPKGAAPEPARAVTGADSAEVAAGPQFQLPAGYDYPPVGGRNVSADIAPEPVGQQVLVVNPVNSEFPSKVEIENYLNRMMHQHTENAAFTTSQGMMPYARLPQEVVDGP